jgi:hypothetical protein
MILLKVGAKMTSVRMVQVGGTYRLPPAAQGSLPSISMGFVSDCMRRIPVQFILSFSAANLSCARHVVLKAIGNSFIVCGCRYV